LIVKLKNMNTGESEFITAGKETKKGIYSKDDKLFYDWKVWQPVLMNCSKCDLPMRIVVDNGGDHDVYNCDQCNPVHCVRCNEKLDSKTMVSMELSNTTGKYYKGGIPKGEKSQGWFDFGQACAKAIIKNKGVCEYIKGRI